MTIKATVRSKDSVNQNTAKLQLARLYSAQDVFSVHPSFTHQYNRSYVTLYKRRPSSFLSKIKSVNLSMAGDVLGVVLWAVSIPFIFSLGAVAVA
ncbi:MAG: hypothetical protein Q4G44_05345 [Alcaligenaceae bacterium]|nr:hypothetical protein [Alcaligenaceae bacterium]